MISSGIDFTVDGCKLDRWAGTTLAYLQHPEQCLLPSKAPKTTRLLKEVQGRNAPVSSVTLNEIKRLLKGIQTNRSLGDAIAATIALTRLDHLMDTEVSAQLWQS
jgi:hypothetical protein